MITAHGSTRIADGCACAPLSARQSTISNKKGPMLFASSLDE